MAKQAKINGAMLQWAREKAGLAIEDAAARAKIIDTKKATGAERLAEFEAGDVAPTVGQLRSLADAYRRPLVTFYLQKPPLNDAKVADFRTLGDAEVGTQSFELSTLLRKLRARQQQVKDLLIDGGARPLPFVGKHRDERDHWTIATDIRAELKFPIESQMALTDRDELFRVLRSRVEGTGIFVQIIGDLGSYHSQIDPEEFRGIALADSVAPFVAINANDAQAALSFSLIHETAHIWIGETGISNVSPFSTLGRRGSVENLCNKVAAEFLLPEELFLRSWRELDPDFGLAQKVNFLSKEWKVSRAVVARRLLENREIADAEWWGLYNRYQAEWRERRTKLKSGSGPGYYTLAKRRLGRALIRTVLNAVDEGNLTYTQASRILDVKSGNFDRLRDQPRR